VYGQAQKALQTQVPAIQTLYAALVQGLQSQGQLQTQNVVNSADMRGVGRASLAGDVQGQLGQVLAQQTGQLGAQQAQDTAAAQLGIGQLGVQKANNVVELAKSLQAYNQGEAKAKLDTQQTNRQYQLDTKKAQQDFNVSQASYEKRQADAAAADAARKAEQAAAFDITTVSQSQLSRQLRVFLGGVRGKDGHVSPENLAKAYNTWQQAGLDAPSFWKNFQGLWNPKQSTYNDQFHYFVQKGV
jgi:hypothetical protein